MSVLPCGLWSFGGTAVLLPGFLWSCFRFRSARATKRISQTPFTCFRAAAAGSEGVNSTHSACGSRGGRAGRQAVQRLTSEPSGKECGSSFIQDRNQRQPGTLRTALQFFSLSQFFSIRGSFFKKVAAASMWMFVFVTVISICHFEKVSSRSSVTSEAEEWLGVEMAAVAVFVQQEEKSGHEPLDTCSLT